MVLTAFWQSVGSQAVYLFFHDIGRENQPRYLLFCAEIEVSTSGDTVTLRSLRGVFMLNTPAVNSFEFESVLTTPRACRFEEATLALHPIEQFLQAIAAQEHKFLGRLRRDKQVEKRRHDLERRFPSAARQVKESSAAAVVGSYAKAAERVDGTCTLIPWLTPDYLVSGHTQLQPARLVDLLRKTGDLEFHEVTALLATACKRDLNQVPLRELRAKVAGLRQLKDYRALAYLSSHLNTEYVIRGGPRKEILELPEEALREAILNAVAHRDYRLTGHIQVHISLDRVEILNPGGLVAGLKLSELGRVSRPRNPLLFALMHRMDLVEDVGSGIRRIRGAMKRYGLHAPLIEAGDTWFSVTFRRKPQHAAIEQDRERQGITPPVVSIDEGVKEGVSEGVNRLMVYIRQHPGLRTPAISKGLRVPAKTIERWVKQLKMRGVIQLKGSPKKGGYHSIPPGGD